MDSFVWQADGLFGYRMLLDHFTPNVIYESAKLPQRRQHPCRAGSQSPVRRQARCKDSHHGQATRLEDQDRRTDRSRPRAERGHRGGAVHHGQTRCRGQGLVRLGLKG